MFGKDIFNIAVSKDLNGNYKVIPAGSLTGQSCNPGTSGSTSIDTSYGCTELVLTGQPLP